MNEVICDVPDVPWSIPMAGVTDHYRQVQKVPEFKPKSEHLNQVSLQMSLKETLSWPERFQQTSRVLWNQREACDWNY